MKNVFSSVASLVASIGFYKTMQHIQRAYDSNMLPYAKALRLVGYLRRLYRNVGNTNLPEWMTLK